MTISTRAFIESLLLGTSGSTRTMDADRFHVVSPDSDTDSQPSNVAERALDIELDAPTALDGWNSLDASVINRQHMTVRISYLLTNQGGDAAEGLSEQAGPGTINEIRDRAGTDAHAISVVLNWHENYAGSDPRIIAITQDGPPSMAVRGDRLVMEMPFSVTSQFTVPGTSYSP